MTYILSPHKNESLLKGHSTSSCVEQGPAAKVMNGGVGRQREGSHSPFSSMDMLPADKPLVHCSASRPAVAYGSLMGPRTLPRDFLLGADG